jgi:hypothetical protein
MFLLRLDDGYIEPRLAGKKARGGGDAGGPASHNHDIMRAVSRYAGHIFLPLREVGRGSISKWRSRVRPVDYFFAGHVLTPRTE